MIEAERLKNCIDTAYEAVNTSKVGPVFIDDSKTAYRQIACGTYFETLRVLLDKEISEKESWQK